jgi:hypothetical protein
MTLPGYKHTGICSTYERLITMYGHQKFPQNPDDGTRVDDHHGVWIYSEAEGVWWYFEPKTKEAA